MKPLSIQLYTVRELTKDGNHLPVLKEIADIGYAGVEGHGFGMSNRDWRAAIEDLGMVVSSTWTSVDEENLAQAVDLAGELGTTHLVAGFWIQDLNSRDALMKTCEKAQKAAAYFKPHGIDLSLHNHWMEFENFSPGVRPVDIIVKECPDVYLEIDIYWAAAFGLNKPQDEVARFRDRAKLLHVKDGPLERGAPMVAVGHGLLDIPATLCAADPAVTAWHVVELDEYAGPMMDAVRASHAYLTGAGLSIGK